MTFECEETEKRQATGEIETGGYVTLCGQLSRILTRIGLGTKPVIDPDSDTDPDRPYWENWKEDPKWWTDLNRRLGNRLRDYYSEGVPSLTGVFPHNKEIELADGGEAALEFGVRVIGEPQPRSNAK